MKHLLTIIISATVAYATLFGMYNYLPVKYLTIESNQSLGASITTILATDKLSDSRSVINTNFTNLNDNKMEMSTTSVASITTLGGLTSANSLTSATSLVTVGTVTSGTWNSLFAAGLIDGDDINSNIAGRSLTLTSASPDTLDLDVGIYTETFTFMLASSSLSTTTGAMAHPLPNAITITRVSCSTGTGASAGTTTIQIDERAEATPNTGGTDILTAQLDCGAGHTNSTTSFANAGITADNLINLDIDKTDDQASGSTPTQVRVTVEYTIDD